MINVEKCYLQKELDSRGILQFLPSKFNYVHENDEKKTIGYIFYDIAITLLKKYAITCESSEEIISNLNKDLNINNTTCTFATVTCCI